MLYESTLYEESKVVKFIGIENGIELASGWREGEMGTKFQFCEMKESWKSTEP